MDEKSQLSREVDAFLLDGRARSLSPKTLDFYAAELRAFLRYLDGAGIVSPAGIGAGDVRAYLAKSAEHRNAGGVNCAYRVIKTWLRWVWAERELTTPCPIAKIKAPRVSAEPLEPPALDDIRAMVAVCERSHSGDRDRALLLFMLDTGARAGEVLALNIGDVDAKSGAVVIRRGKGGKGRTVFMGARARRELLRYLRHREAAGPADALWATLEGGRLRYPGLRTIIRRRSEHAGVPTPAIHGFRRAFALLSLRNGMDVYSLQRLMGHASLVILRRYLAQTEGDLQTAHEAASPADMV